MTIRTYDPSQVDVLIAVAYEVTGFAEGSLVNLSKNSDNFSTSVGARGNSQRLHITDKTYSLEINLAQTSPSNALLNALSSVDNISRRGIFPVFIKDSSGQSLFLAQSCWISQTPDASYSSSIETRSWVITCDDVVFNLSGNDEDAIESDANNYLSIADALNAAIGEVL